VRDENAGRRSTRLYLVRHGEVPGEGVLHGHVDVPLTPRGREQMEAVASRLAAEPLAGVYSSDLQRARDGARFAAVVDHTGTVSLRDTYPHAPSLFDSPLMFGPSSQVFRAKW